MSTPIKQTPKNHDDNNACDMDIELIPEMKLNSKHQIDRESQSQKKHHKVCFCYKNKMACLKVCFPVVLLLLIALGIMGFFLFPRIPTFVFSTPYATSGESPLNFSKTNTTATIAISFWIDVYVTSKNYLDYDVSSISLDGTLINTNNNDAEIGMKGNGVVVNAIIQKQFTSVIKMPLIFKQTINGSFTDLLVDRVVMNIIDACGFSGDLKSDLVLKYDIVLDIALVPSGLIPIFHSDSRFACPLTQGEWNTALNKLI